MKSINELKQIRQQENEESWRVQESIRLGYCPECGEKLIVVQKQSWLGKLLGTFRITKWCPADKNHYNDSGTYFDGSGYP